ncbi:lysophospholipase [Pseudomonas alcaligenes]|uniref:Lysophospholipase n=1 Tax=Aquipseudomonas alcaligenes TaxID=43263 RepID=A0ABR7RYP6_AQUAC|nr:SGNH/GDSL hydrolase family protein [Pseudomonas alcaligenes]MBC9249660.1 lysophospholipase [Pseudomonas alcaligenes]
MTLRALGWWGLTLALLPLALPQALWVRRTALRLPPAGGDIHGLAGGEFAGTPLRLLVLGESTVAGVGVELLEAALAGQLAQALSQRLQRPVAWRAHGENGITAGEACERLLPAALAEPADLALLVFGVNDTTHLSSLGGWARAVAELARALGGQGARVVCSGVPPIQHFSALPWLLRKLLGLRAGLMDARLRQVCAGVGADYQALELEFAAEYLAADGYHPSALGYRVWAEGLAERLASQMALSVAV